MILVCSDGKVEKQHLVRTVVKAGLASLLITSYCGQENERGIQQVPDSFWKAVCPKCKEALAALQIALGEKPVDIEEEEQVRVTT